MDIHLELPTWMVERIVAILREHPYTGSAEIVQSIKDQVEAHDFT